MSDKERLIIEQIPHLRRYAAALLRDPERADDLVQDCLTRAVSRRHLWRPSGTMRTWLFTILHNLYVNQVRKKAREPDVISDTDVLERHAEAPNQESGLAKRDLAAALAKLPAEQRIVVLLVGLEGHSYAEAAAIVGAPVGTVMSRLARGREKLRQIMEAENGSKLRVVK